MKRYIYVFRHIFQLNSLGDKSALLIFAYFRARFSLNHKIHQKRLKGILGSFFYANTIILWLACKHQSDDQGGGSEPLSHTSLL